MTVALWVLAACASALVMAMGSRAAIGHASQVAHALGAPPFLVGMTLVAVGTDIPEIVNSIVAAYSGHGDITLGDATGSVFTQITLGLGLFPFMAGIPIVIERRNAWLLAVLTVAALTLGALLYGDGALSPWDALVLIAGWLVASATAWRLGVRARPLRPIADRARRPVALHVTAALAALTVVGGAAAVLVAAVAAISATAGIPEYMLSFFGASVATSLPELAVEFTALRRGERDMALGDVFGSCLVDASLAVAAGPLLFPTRVTADLAFRGSLLAAAAMMIAGASLAVRRKHDWRSGLLLLACYVAGYFFGLAPTR